MAEELVISINNSLKEILSGWSLDKIKRMKSILSSNSKIAKGILINSFAIQVSRDSKVSINFAKYGEYVDKGRKPGRMPPISAIEKWCQVRGIPKEAAFAIAKKIEAEGIKPVPFIDEVMMHIEELSKLIAGDVANILVASIPKEIERTINIK